MLTKTLEKPDMIGALASGLCTIHCMATPFLFIAQSCSVSGSCGSGPLWWSAVDYFFIGITFFAVYQSGKTTSKVWIKHAMYASWVILSALILNEKMGFVHLSAWFKHVAAFSMISLHLYNLKYCQCQDEVCCAT